jgi:hypothetical protein
MVLRLGRFVLTPSNVTVVLYYTTGVLVKYCSAWRVVGVVDAVVVQLSRLPLLHLLLTSNYSQ